MTLDAYIQELRYTRNQNHPEVKAAQQVKALAEALDDTIRNYERGDYKRAQGALAAARLLVQGLQ